MALTSNGIFRVAALALESPLLLEAFTETSSGADIAPEDPYNVDILLFESECRGFIAEVPSTRAFDSELVLDTDIPTVANNSFFSSSMVCLVLR